MLSTPSSGSQICWKHQPQHLFGNPRAQGPIKLHKVPFRWLQEQKHDTRISFQNPNLHLPLAPKRHILSNSSLLQITALKTILLLPFGGSDPRYTLPSCPSSTALAHMMQPCSEASRQPLANPSEVATSILFPHQDQIFK